VTAGPALLPLLLLAAAPLGLWLARGLLPARSRVARFGTATLAGAGVLMGVVHALLCVGVPARLGAPLVGAAGLAAGCWLLAREWRRRDPSAAPARRRPARTALLEGAPLALLGLLLFVPLSDARQIGITENDTVRIWAPKAVRALTEAPPRLEGWDQAHPEYPRGVAILTGALSMPLGGLDPRLPRFVGLFLFAATLLCAFDALSARGNPWGGLAAMAILGSLPVPMRHATSGLMDGTLGGFILLAGLGLSAPAPGRRAIAVAVAGAWGALATKDEGLPFFGAVMLVLAWDFIRRPRGWTVQLGQAIERPRIATALVLSALVAAPWVLLRSQVHGEPLLLQNSPQNAGLLLMRADLILRELGHLALGLQNPFPGGYSQPDVPPGGDLMVFTAIACGVVLLVGRRRGGFTVLPAMLLLVTDFFVIAFSTVGIDWQLVTAYNRLTLQVFPLLLVAAVDKLTSPDPADPGPAPAEARAAAAA
jgi:hypothetical protein